MAAVAAWCCMVQNRLRFLRRAPVRATGVQQCCAFLEAETRLGEPRVHSSRQRQRAVTMAFPPRPCSCDETVTASATRSQANVSSLSRSAQRRVSGPAAMSTGTTTRLLGDSGTAGYGPSGRVPGDDRIGACGSRRATTSMTRRPAPPGRTRARRGEPPAGDTGRAPSRQVPHARQVSSASTTCRACPSLYPRSAYRAAPTTDPADWPAAPGRRPVRSHESSSHEPPASLPHGANGRLPPAAPPAPPDILIASR